MALSLEISSSIIFPKFADSFDAVTIDITPPSPTHPGAPVITHSKPPILATGPENPLYRLPQSLSSGGLKVHLNAFVKPRVVESIENQAQTEITRDSRTSIVDKDHILYEISKTPIGADYSLACFRHGKQTGGYGYGGMSFKAGWFSGGVWTVEYVTKAPGKHVEYNLKLTVDEGGKEDGVWKLVEPVQRVVAKEKLQEEGSAGENGRVIELYEDEVVGLAGMPEHEWRDFLTACWITKVWREATKTPFLGHSAREGEAGKLARW